MCVLLMPYLPNQYRERSILYHPHGGISSQGNLATEMAHIVFNDNDVYSVTLRLQNVLIFMFAFQNEI